MRIDFVADVTCPWCAIGLRSLEDAIRRVAGRVAPTLHVQPFELNPGLPREGEPIADYALRRHGAGAAELAARQALIRERAAAVGLDFPERTHVYNTFDAHRLLHWAGLHGRQIELLHALLRAYHERGANPAAPEVLLDAASEASLDRTAASDVLASGAHGDDVRSAVRGWQRLGITGVPAVVIDGRHLIEGAQPVDVYERALTSLAPPPAD